MDPGNPSLVSLCVVQGAFWVRETPSRPISPHHASAAQLELCPQQRLTPGAVILVSQDGQST